MNGQTLGFLNTLVSHERSNDPYSRITSIHIGNIQVGLQNEFIESRDKRVAYLLCEIDGISIIMDARCENEYVVLRDKEEFKPKEKEILIGGVKPTKNWLKRNLNIK